MDKTDFVLYLSKEYLNHLINNKKKSFKRFSYKDNCCYMQFLQKYNMFSMDYHNNMYKHFKDNEYIKNNDINPNKIFRSNEQRELFENGNKFFKNKEQRDKFNENFEESTCKYQFLIKYKLYDQDHYHEIYKNFKINEYIEDTNNSHDYNIKQNFNTNDSVYENNDEDIDKNNYEYYIMNNHFSFIHSALIYYNIKNIDLSRTLDHFTVVDYLKQIYFFQNTSSEGILNNHIHTINECSDYIENMYLYYLQELKKILQFDLIPDNTLTINILQNLTYS